MKIYNVEVFGGDCITKIGIFTSVKKAKEAIRADFKKTGYDSHYTLKLGNEAETADFELVMYAVPKSDPKMSWLDVEGELCLSYNVASYVLDEVISEEMSS